MSNLYTFCLGLSLMMLFSGIKHSDISIDPDFDISIEREAQRDIIEIKKEQTSIALSHLIPGNEYSVFFSDGMKNLDYSINFDQSKVKLIGYNKRTFQFIPKYSTIEFFLDFETLSKTKNTQIFISTANSTIATKKQEQVEKNSLNPPMIITNLTVDELVTDVFIRSACFDVENIDFTGAAGNVGIAKFEDASTFAIKEGVVMGNFNVTQVVGPNTGTGTGGGIGGVSNDPDLQDLAGGIPINDGQILEFDFVPTVGQMSFNYVWGSEEYCDYVDVAFNDVFGFFISGPGINGPYTNNAENIALIPGTNTPVSINEVNWVDNPSYYITNNIFGGGTCTPGELAADPAAPDDIELDGWTEKLTAFIDVIPCETYHVKLAIGDGQDNVFGSAVFLEANSFFTGDAINFEVNYSSPDADFVYENCGNDVACIRFFRPEEIPDTVDVSIPITEDASSVATEGVDYQILPDTIVFPAGEIEVEFCLEVIDDNIVEGIEEAVFLIENICACEDPLIEININDVPVLIATLDAPTEVCVDGQFDIDVDVNADAPPDVTYLWSTGETTSSISDQISETTSYMVTVTDGCDQEMILDHTVEVIPRPSAELSGDGILCATNTDCVDLTFDLLGTGPWNISYTYNGQNINVNNIAATPHTISACQPGTYTLTNVEAFGCDGDVVGSVTLDETNIVLDITSDQALCTGQSTGNINLDVQDGIAPYSFTWDPDLGDVEDPQNVAPGSYSVTVSDVNGCTQLTQVEVTDPEPIILVDFSTTPVGCEGPTSGAIDISVTGGTGSYTFDWNDPAPDVEDPTGLGLGAYQVTIIDENGCGIISDFILINPDNSAPVALAGQDQLLTCTTSQLTLEGTASSPDGDPLILWTTEDGNIVSGETTTDIVVDAAGTYTMNVSNPDGTCPTFDMVEVVEFTTPPDVDAGPELIINCASTSINLQGNSENNTDVIWSTLDGNIISGGDSLAPLVDLPGSYIITGTHQISGCVNTDTVNVLTDFTLPEINIEDAEILTCQLTQISLSGNGSSTGPEYEYIWSTTDGNIVGDNTLIDVDVNEPGTYNLVVRNTLNGCEENLDIIIDEDVDELLIDIQFPEVLTCSTDMITIDATGSERNVNSVMEWSATSGGNIISGSDTDLLLVDSPGEYTFTLTDTLTGCISTQSILVDQDLTEPIVDAGVADMLTCFVTEVNLDGTSNYPASEVEYSWTTPNGSIVSGADTQNPLVSIAGTYILSVRYLGTGCSSIDSVIVIADENIPQIEVVNTGPVLNCNVISLNLDIDLSGNVSQFDIQWSTGGSGNIISGGDTENPLVDQPGSYQVTVIDTVLGCVTSATVDVIVDDLEPNVNAGEPDALSCSITSLNLDGSLSDNGAQYTYLWSTTNGNIVSGANQMAPEIDQPGTYILQVIDTNNGCSATDEVIIDLLDTPPVADAVVNDELTCSIENVILDASASIGNGPLTYDWSTSDGNIVSGNNIEFPVVDEPGTYDLVVTNSLNGCTASVSVEVLQNINDPISTVQNPDVLDCITSSVMVEGLGSSSGPDFDYLWTSSDGNIISTTTDLNAEVDQPGTYVLTVLDTRNGCFSTSSIVVNEDIQDPEAFIENPDILTCEIETITLNGDGSSQGNDFTYEWQSQDGTTIGTSLSVDVFMPGPYTLIVTDNSNGCTSLTSIEVMEDRNDPDAQFTAVSPGCEEVTGSINITNLQGTPPYSVSVDGGVTYTEDLNFTNLEPGIYDVYLRDGTGCAISEQLEIDENIPLVSTLASNVAVIGFQQSYQIDLTLNLEPIEIESITWSPEIGLSCTNCEDPVASPDQTTEYTVTVVSDKGCIVEDNVLIRVDNTPLIYVPNVFSPNEDGNNDKFAIFAKEGHVNMVLEFTVFDRWGNKLFENYNIPPNSVDSGWDGTFQENEMNPAVFVYTALLELADGRLHKLAGDFTLVR